ncbi:hypothetical protein RRG08_023697 [Elysia crispata]|uniref:Uncharacterized protein n=1 Tax=Elysia crispata TaxID=231223 RepID=A0AAE0Z2Z2_9GAST|nr:hypothetical protein RRG08_023697 [Elysia crispata]
MFLSRYAGNNPTNEVTIPPPGKKSESDWKEQKRTKEGLSLNHEDPKSRTHLSIACSEYPGIRTAANPHKMPKCP